MTGARRGASAPETLLGFDFGVRRIGVAIGNTLTGDARPLATLDAVPVDRRFERIAALLREWAPARLVVGRPLDEDGSVTETTSTEACGSGNTCTATATTYSGGCVYVEGSAPTLSWLVISACRLPEYSMSSDDAGNTTLVYSMGGGAYVQNGEPSFTEVVFRKNAADAGGGLYVGSGSNVTVLQSLFDANVASSGAGATTSDSSTTFTNVIFANNVASGTGSNTGGAAVDVSGGVFTSNFVTGVGNQGTSSIYLSDSASAAVVSTILMANSVGYLVDGDATGTVSFSYGDIFNAAGLGNVGSGVTDPDGSLGNISSDAMFVAFTDDSDYSDDNLHLTAGSPGTDAGSPSDTDADGTPADMGAYGGPNGGW